MLFSLLTDKLARHMKSLLVSYLYHAPYQSQSCTDSCIWYTSYTGMQEYIKQSKFGWENGAFHRVRNQSWCGVKYNSGFSFKNRVFLVAMVMRCVVLRREFGRCVKLSFQSSNAVVEGKNVPRKKAHVNFCCDLQWICFLCVHAVISWSAAAAALRLIFCNIPVYYADVTWSGCFPTCSQSCHSAVKWHKSYSGLFHFKSWWNFCSSSFFCILRTHFSLQCSWG